MIIAAEVKRDEQGYWTHPALVRSGCETSAELSYWLRTHKLQCFVMTMRDEAPEAFAAGFTDEAPMPVAGYRSHRMMMAGFWDLSTIPATDPSATGFVIPKILTPPHRVVVQPGNGKSQFPRSRRFLNTR
ncbi:hypothetical protein RH201207_p200005 (plasmid) [Klebsiella pneumoniae]|nr:hypothetical protein RH201207_p200005 [Klebsiella pneumoniae]